MFRRFHPLLLGFSCCLLLAVAAGCQANRAAVAPPEPPAVPISHAVPREVTDYVEFTGRTEAVHSVDIRPRVTGYLMKMPFKEGAEVKAGDLLFVVDPRPYKAQVDQAQGQVDLYQASLKLAKVTLARDRAINSLSPGSISQQQFDQEQAVVDEAEARVKAFKKSMEIYTLNHEFTNVTSPIDGQISRYYLTLGNLVNQDQTLLTTVVSVDPMYAYFEMDEPTLLRIRRAINEGKIKLPKEGTHAGPDGPPGRGGVPAPGDDQLREQPGQPDDGEHPGAGRLPEPQAGGGPAAALAGDVRADPPADRPAAPGAPGDRPGHRVGPGDQVRLRARRRQQGPVPAASRPVRSRRTASASSRRASSRMTGSSSAPCSRSARGWRSGRSRSPCRRSPRRHGR